MHLGIIGTVTGSPFVAFVTSHCTLSWSELKASSHARTDTRPPLRVLVGTYGGGAGFPASPRVARLRTGVRITCHKLVLPVASVDTETGVLEAFRGERRLQMLLGVPDAIARARQPSNNRCPLRQPICFLRK